VDDDMWAPATLAALFLAGHCHGAGGTNHAGAGAFSAGGGFFGTATGGGFGHSGGALKKVTGTGMFTSTNSV